MYQDLIWICFLKYYIFFINELNPNLCKNIALNIFKNDEPVVSSF